MAAGPQRSTPVFCVQKNSPGRIAQSSCRSRRASVIPHNRRCHVEGPRDDASLAYRSGRVATNDDDHRVDDSIRDNVSSSSRRRPAGSRRKDDVSGVTHQLSDDFPRYALLVRPRSLQTFAERAVNRPPDLFYEMTHAARLRRNFRKVLRRNETSSHTRSVASWATRLRSACRTAACPCGSASQRPTSSRGRSAAPSAGCRGTPAKRYAFDRKAIPRARFSFAWLNERELPEAVRRLGAARPPSRR
jgi:hypothetical protein